MLLQDLLSLASHMPPPGTCPTLSLSPTRCRHTEIPILEPVHALSTDYSDYKFAENIHCKKSLSTCYDYLIHWTTTTKPFRVLFTNLKFLIPISLQLDEVNLWYLRLFNQWFIVWNIRGRQHQVAKIQRFKNKGLWCKNCSLIWNRLGTQLCLALSL